MKHSIKYALTATVATVAFGSTGYAADLLPIEEPMQPTEFVEPVSIDESFGPLPMWTGLYVGAHGGVDTQKNAYLYTPGTFGDKTETCYCIFGGGQIGGDYQVNEILIGAVVDASFYFTEHKIDFPSGGVNYYYNLKKKYNAGGRIKLGYAVNEFLVYGTGGMVYNRSDLKFLSSDGVAANARNTGTTAVAFKETTWTAGGGLEYLFTPDVSVFGEYLYSPSKVTLNAATTNSPLLGTETLVLDQTSHSVKLGVNVRLNSLFN